MRKLLITGGDSFADNAFKITWPTFVKKGLNFEESIDVGLGATGNKFIKMRVMYEISKELKKTNPEDIFVAITWSGPNRNCIFLPNEDINLYPDHEWSINPNNFDNSSVGKWVLLNNHWSFNLNKIYYKNFENEHNSIIDTLHNILDLQNFLKVNNIDYIMTTSWNIISDNHHDTNHNEIIDSHIGNNKKLQLPEFKWIRDLIDWDKFIPLSGQWEWTNKKFPDRSGPESHHPFKHEQELFANEIIIPFIKKKYEKNINNR